MHIMDKLVMIGLGLVLLLSVVSGKRQLIVVSVPGGRHASYYINQLGSLAPIVNMFSEYSERVAEGGDDFMVIYSSDQEELLNSVTFHADTWFLLANEALDLWMRDFTSTISDLQIKFKYLPDYLRRRDARVAERGFTRLINNQLNLELPATRYSNLILDGGNLVDDGEGRIVITKRALSDNRMRSRRFRKKLTSRLKALGASRSICLLEDHGDATGHADGLVAFLDTQTILLAHYGYDAEYNRDASALRRTFGDQLNIVKLPCYEATSVQGSNFDSAEGSYINMLVTDNAVYVPQFDSAEDQAASDVVRANTEKMVLPVNTAQVAVMGGNVRCTTWQMYHDTDIALALVGQAEKRTQ